MSDVVRLHLPFVVRDVSRTGQVRYYFRRRPWPKVRLPDVFGSDAFMAAYHAARDGAPSASAEAIDHRRGATGSLRWFVVGYQSSPEFRALAPSTQAARRRILDRLCEKHGHKPLAAMAPRHVRKLRDERADKVEAANAIVKALRVVFAWAVEAEPDRIERNPAADVPLLRSGSQGYHSWSIEEVERFERAHPVGTKARLALALFLYTAQRKSDVVRMGRQHVRAGWLTLTQFKGRNRAPVTLSLPVLPELQAVIDASPTGDLAFLVTGFGKPFTANGFGNWFRRRCDEAGLPHCSAHGLRKAAAARLAEAGCSEEEIKAWTGHRTSKEVTRYTRGARQKKLASAAVVRLEDERNRNSKGPTSGDEWDHF
ncbi:tyrosine-type recombinase/integrase [Oceanibacterium hippocampi]|uniref:Tyrosine recombinase XerC n=1 Tax=Oceanibacterium hippocampi TaxID=745714 RepID=A0A1Y5U086_9PROT|nr:tyrosine-type recombinase/integrase [Oceanibacterium hippocampi]SLN77258.1 Tyrosine recombinase XerC [Oceanibacterium hippocampi]